MGFNCGILGLPNVGKSTLFNALTSTQLAESKNYRYMFSIGRSKHLLETHEKLGWKIDKKPSHEITKKLK